ncbi:MAG: hypothetical protein ABIT70_05745 [Sulfuriferula sp.]
MNPRPFFDTARDIRRGQFIEECADKMQEVIAHVAEHNKPAKLIIELTISPASRTGAAMNVSDKVTAKIPALPSGETILFVTPDNNLVPNDPHQKSLDLKSVDADTGELKSINK